MKSKKKFLFDVTYQLEDTEPDHMIVRVDSKADIEEAVRNEYMKICGITREEFGDSPITLLEVTDITNK